MSKQFAEYVLSLSDKTEIRNEIIRRQSEVDNAFYSHLLETSTAHRSGGRFDEAINVLRILFDAGQIAKNHYITALSFLHVARLEVERRDFERAISMAKNCVSESDKASDTQSVMLKADAYHLQGELYFQQFSKFEDALRSLQNALTQYVKLQKTEEAERVQATIEKIHQQSKQGAFEKPLADVLDEIVISRVLLNEIVAEIGASEKRLAEVQQEHSRVQQTIAHLSEEYRSLSEENNAIQEQNRLLREECENLRLRRLLLSTAHQIPLWVAVVREDLSRGEISVLTVSLIERMRLKYPEYAEPLLAEIYARNGSSSNTPLNLSGLTGDARLFAGIANANALESTDPLGAIEGLIEAWETYLSELSANIQ